MFNVDLKPCQLNDSLIPAKQYKYMNGFIKYSSRVGLLTTSKLTFSGIPLKLESNGDVSGKPDIGTKMCTFMQTVLSIGH